MPLDLFRRGSAGVASAASADDGGTPGADGPRPGGGFWQSLKYHMCRPEEIPRALGLALVCAYLAGMMVIGLATRHSHLAFAYRQWAEGKCEEVLQLADTVSALPERTPEAVLPYLRRFVRRTEAAGVVITDADGVVVAEHVPGATPPDWMTSPSAAPPATGEPATDESHERWLVVSAAVASPRAGPLGTVLAAFPREEFDAGAPSLSGTIALGVLGALGLLLLIYRAIRRALRPVSAVRDQLLAFREGLETQLTELRLEHTRNAVSEAWNQLIDLIQELQNSLEAVTSQRELIDALQTIDNAQAREILDAFPDGVIFVEPGGQIALANPAARRLVQLPGDLEPGTPLEAIEIDAELARVLRRLTAGTGRNHQVTVHHTIRNADGPDTVLALTVVRMPPEARTPGSLVVVRDVSQQKQAEKARDEFLHQVTHEFRTPLSNIRAYTETLMEGILEDREAQKECLNVINAEARRLGRLVEEVLTASQLEVGSIRLRQGEIEFGRLLQQAVQDVQAAADQKNIELLAQLPPKIPNIKGDKEKLAVVLNNLLGNAIKYTPEGGRVALHCEYTEQEMIVSVTDTGIGIPSDEVERVFEKFYRSKMDAVREVPGTGLGLATARQIVRLHGGDITVRSIVGEGSTFTVVLPRAGAPVGPPQIHPPTARPAPAPQPDTSTEAEALAERES